MSIEIFYQISENPRVEQPKQLLYLKKPQTVKFLRLLVHIGLLKLISHYSMLFEPLIKEAGEWNSVCISDSTSGNITIFHFSSFSFKLFLSFVTTPSTFSYCALLSFLFLYSSIIQKQFFNLIIYFLFGSIDISFLAHKQHC